MSKIDELLKNEKVEWKKLGEVCEIIRGVRVTKKDLIDNGQYPVVSGGIGYMGYVNQYNRDGDTITIAQYGTAGYVCWQKEKFWANDVCFSLYPNDKVLKKFLYYFLLQKQEYLYSISNKSAVPYSISKEKILRIDIPIPSIETQEKIVKTLDKFTNYVTELQAELQARTKQYEYYRDMLLSEEYLNKISAKIDGIKNNEDISFYTLSQVFNTRNGYTPSKSVKKYWNSEDIPWFKMEDIRENGNILSYAKNYVSNSAIKGEPFEQNSIILSTSATIGEHALITVPFLANQRFTCFSLKGSYKKEVNIKYAYYYFYIINKWCRNNIKIGNFPSVDVSTLLTQTIPIPDVYIQNKVVEILDKFQSLLADTKGLLPQEIEQRQKQYEYYREKLLTFDTVCDNTHTHTRIVLSNRYFAILQEAAEFVGIKQSCVVWKKLGEISIYSKERISTDNLNEYNYVGVENLLKDKLGKTKSSYVPKDGTMIKFCINDILIGNIRPYLRKIWMADVDGGTNGDVLVIHIKEDMNKVVLPKYLFQVLLDERFFEYDIKYSKGAKMPRGDKNKILEYKIPIPSLPVQEYIVSILDKFDALVNDISQGLPKEIELRQKQYEYYREKLLDFKGSN